LTISVGVPSFLTEFPQPLRCTVSAGRCARHFVRIGRGKATLASGPGYKQYPQHHVDLEHGPARVQVTFNGEIVADSSDVITVKESDHEPVCYLPREHVRMDRLIRSDHRTYCPFKGEASYFTLTNGRTAENAVWSYEQPYDEVAPIKGRVAFYPDKVDAINVS
jgi:uncharacterized protein (DUF427 family)